MNAEREQFMAKMVIVIDQIAELHLREMSRKRHFQSRSSGQKRRWAKQRNNQENK